MSVPALELRGFAAGYDPDLAVVRSIGFTVAPGEKLAILGPNGAGKSTLVKAVVGLVPRLGGSVRLDGREVADATPHALARLGLGFVPQTENIFTTLTIRENLQIAAEQLPKPRRADRIAAMFAMFSDLGTRPGTAAGSLSGGQRQMLAAARALLAEPRLLILDEPSAGLSPKLVAEVFATLDRINATGVTLILVEQNVRAALRLADRALVLVDGRVAHDGPAGALAASGRLGALFLGDTREAALP